MQARTAAAALTAVALALVAGCGGSGGGSSASTAASATTATAPAKLIRITVADGKINGDGPVRVSVSKGTAITLRVTADVSDEVHVHGYDLHGDVAPGKPATIGFDADVPGRFEAELESRSLQILQFTVTP